MRVLFLPHAVRQMSRPDRMISSSEVHAILREGEVIEEYADDPRGQSALLLGAGLEGRLLHVVAAPREAYVAVITAYVPDRGLWNADMRTRKGR